MKDDGIKTLCPRLASVKRANETKDYNDASYVLLYIIAKKDDRVWKIVFAGDSDDHSWEHILKNHRAAVTDIEVLFAPHHGRDSGRNYEFLKTLKPKVSLLGNESSEHLAYRCYPEVRITNNQAGYVVIDISKEAITFYVKNFDFARDFRSKRNLPLPILKKKFNAYELGSIFAD